MNTNTELIPSWKVRGICSETRALKSSKTGEVWNHSIKIVAMGGIFDLGTKDAAIFESVGEGIEYRAEGTFEQFNGKTNFNIRSIRPVDGPPSETPNTKEAK